MSTSPSSPLTIKTSSPLTPKSPIKDENENFEEEEGLLSPQDIRSSKFWGFYVGLQDSGRRRFISRADAVDEPEDGSSGPGQPSHLSPGGASQKRIALERTQSANYPASTRQDSWPDNREAARAPQLSRAETFHAAPSPPMRSVSHSPSRSANLKRGQTFHISDSSRVAQQFGNRSPSPTRPYHGSAKQGSKGTVPGDYTATYPGRSTWDNSASRGRAQSPPSVAWSHDQAVKGQASGQPKPYIQRAQTFNVASSSEDHLNVQPTLQGHPKSSSLTRINESLPSDDQTVTKPGMISPKRLNEMQSKPVPPAKDESELGPTRAERIAQYKELRRKELAEQFGDQISPTFDSSDAGKPSRKGGKKKKVPTATLR